MDSTKTLPKTDLMSKHLEVGPKQGPSYLPIWSTSVQRKELRPKPLGTKVKVEFLGEPRKA